MTQKSQRAAVISGVVAVVLGFAAYWIWGPRDIEEDFHPAAALDLDVTVDGQNFPHVVRAAEAHVLMIRFRPGELAPPAEELAVFCYVVGEDGYQPGKIDVLWMERQKPGFPEKLLSVIKGGQPVDVTPPPPPANDPTLQYCCILAPRSFRYNRERGTPLQLHAWMIPVDRDTKRPIANDPGVWFYRHTFEIADDGMSGPESY
jgi:hypothetical protein